MPGPLRLPLAGGTTGALVDQPASPRAALVLAHGAGAGMRHPFMTSLALGLADQGIAVLRFDFPYMDAGGKRPDAPAVAHGAVRAAVDEARRRWPTLPLFAGGKSFGARMTSQAQALQLLPDVRGLVFFGFPLHPAGRPGTRRADHLQQVALPMLFLQGTRDALAEMPLVRGVAGMLGDRATLHVVEGADHGFDVLVRSGRTRELVLGELVETAARWMLRAR